MIGLTGRQELVLAAIYSSILARGYPPTLRELGTKIGVKSTNGVNDHLIALRKKGYLEGDTRGRSRTLVLSARGRAHMRRLDVPTPAETPAGQAAPTIEVYERDLRTPVHTMKRPSFAAEAAFAFVARGNGMNECGIFAGDLLFITHATPKHGDTVLLKMEDRVLVRRFTMDSTRMVRLSAPGTQIPALHLDIEDVGRAVVGVAACILRVLRASENGGMAEVSETSG